MRAPVALIALAMVTALPLEAGQPQKPQRWPADKANAWYAKQPWLVGCNFIPSTAVNQLEMWQAESFDPATLDKELGWAASLGMNCVRVYLHDLAWQADADGFKKRMGRYLELADKHKIRTIFVIFDACWLPDPKVGKQPEPVPGVHNSGWVQSPAHDLVTRPKEWDRLKKYVRDVVGHFGQDERILLWDVYNEPGNSKLDERSLPLLEAVFSWARAAKPSQPLSAGVWYGNKTLNDYQLEASDVITFHNYNDAANLKAEIASLKKLGRPVICTEWMARTRNSTVETHLPIFKEANVGCLCWGLVRGKTNTIYPWNSPKGAKEPAVWFHDLLRPDGAAYNPAEAAVFLRLTGRAKGP